MEIKISKPQLKFLVYLIAGIMSIVPLLIYGTIEASSIGFYISVAFILICRRSLFSLICFLYIIMSNIYMQYVPLKFMGGITVTAIVNLMIISVFLLYFFKTRAFKKLFQDRYSLFYYIYVALTIIWYVVNGFIHKLGAVHMLWRLIPVYFSMILVIAAAKEKKYIEDILSVIMVSAILFTLTAYIELFCGKTFFYSLWAGAERYRNGILRVGSTQGDPNILGIFLAPSIFIIMTDKNKKMLGKNFNNTILLFMVLMLILTNSRMTLLSFILGMGAFYWLRGSHQKKSLVICGVAFTFLFSPCLFFFMFIYQAASSGQRVMLMGEAIKHWISNPFLGIGLDQFFIKTEWLTMNEYTKQLAEFGIFAFILYISFYIILIKTFFSHRKYMDKIKLHDASCVLAAIIAFMANSFSLDSYFYYIMWTFPALGIYFFTDKRILTEGE